jgi:phosphoglycolate phosphatase
MYRAVLFDLDGTLLNTSLGVKKSIEYTIKELKLQQLTLEEIRKFIGPPIYQSLQERYNLSDKEAKYATDIFRNIYKERFLFDAIAYPNVFKVLNILKTKGIKIGVATNKREDYTIKLLNHMKISDLCDSIVGSDFENKLTKTDIILKCMKQLDILNEKEVIFIGDTKYDAIGAENCCIDFIGVTYGFGFKTQRDVQEYSSIDCLDNIGELMRYFE